MKLRLNAKKYGRVRNYSVKCHEILKLIKSITESKRYAKIKCNILNLYYTHLFLIFKSGFA
jgi:hypothetical protein